MLNLGLLEIIIIMSLALVVIGPERLPEVLRFLGRQYGKLMRTSNELRRAFMLEAERGEIERRAAAMRQRREEARKRISEQRAQKAANDSDSPDVETVGITGTSFSPERPPSSGVAQDSAMKDTGESPTSEATS